MKLYLVRHASAVDIAPSDDARELTGLGQEEARVTGLALAKLGVKPARIFSSPLRRAGQTAAILAQALQFAGKVAVLSELENGTSTHDLLDALKTAKCSGEVLLVGHMPSLAEHAATLATAKFPGGFPLGKAGVICIETEQLRSNTGCVCWSRQHPQLRELIS